MPRPHRARRPAFAAAVALAAACASGLPLQAQSPPLGFEGVTLLAGGHHAYARLAGLPDGAAPRWVEAAILPPEGACAQPSPPRACDPDAPRAVARAQTFPDGSLEFAFVTSGPFPRRPVRMAPFDRVRVRTTDDAAGSPTSIATAVVAALEVSTIDTAADRLVGTGPAGARLSVTANRSDGGFVFAQAVVGADGAWMADLAGRLDLAPGAFGAVSVVVDRVTTQVSWRVPSADVRLGDPTVVVSGPVGDVAAAQLTCLDRHVGATGTAVVWGGANGSGTLSLRNANGGLAPLQRDGVCTDLQLSIGDVPMRIRIPEGKLTFDLAADTLSGSVWWSPGSYRLRVGSVERTVQVSEARTPWSADFSGAVDLRADTAVDVTPIEPLSPATWTLRGYPRRVLTVDPLTATVTGRGIAGDSVTLVARSQDLGGTPVGLTVVGADGAFQVVAREDDGTAVRLNGPVELAVAFGDNAYRVSPPALLDLHASPETFFVMAAPLRAAALANRDTVNGTALPGARLHVLVGGDDDGAVLDVTAGDDGRWEADFTDLADLVPGMPVTVEATASDGYRSTLSFPVFRASAQVGGDRVLIEGHPGLEVAVEASRAGATIGRGGCTVPDGATTCTARVQEAALGALPLAGGDEVVVLPSVGASASLTLFAFAAHIDTNAFSVVGNCPPNGSIQVRFHAAEGAAAPFDSATTADSNGVCDYELSRSEWELVTPGLSADLIHALPGGHRLFSTGVYEQVRVTNNGPVEGLAEPFAPVTLTLRTPAGVDRPPTRLRADGDGRWTADASLTPRAPGETLVVDDGRKHHAIPYTPLVGWWFDRLGTVVGVTGPDQPVKVIHHIDPTLPRPVCGGPSEYTVVADIADPAGTFAFEAPPTDACAVGQAELAAVLANGDEVRYRLPTDVVPGGRVFLPVGVAGE